MNMKKLVYLNIAYKFNKMIEYQQNYQYLDYQKMNFKKRISKIQ